jgi:hypothetical protein
MDALLDFLPLAQSLQSKGIACTSHGKHLEPCAQEYFAILCRLVDSLPIKDGSEVCGMYIVSFFLSFFLSFIISFIRSSFLVTF